MIHLKLYGTEGCHLCHDAQALVTEVTQKYSNIRVQHIDIVEDDDLMAAYGISIPVLAATNELQLFWPFSAEDIKSLIDSAQ